MCSAYNIVFMIPCLLAEQQKQHLETRICSLFSVLGNSEKTPWGAGRGKRLTPVLIYFCKEKKKKEKEILGGEESIYFKRSS